MTGTIEDRYADDFATMPVVAILRGLVPREAVAIGMALVESGIRILEVPLNSPEPFESIGLLARAFAGHATVGAGTVLTPGDVDRVRDVGGQIIISPNMNPVVIRRAREAGLVSLPGCLTPTEAFAALEAGAHAVKLFPGELVTPGVARAMAAVLPKGTRLLVVGGVAADTIGTWNGSVVHGFGIGSSLFKPGMTPDDVRGKARDLVAAVRDWAAASRA
ncbi:2-dehydro-3-deoxy-6-phosphogalactonate aldolase [Lichenihabitans sp. Uapishka_5]|uniref:2-dehydro-3-deoxy-6-phosphogalactonate aldolase n=1 Tax=Lichenihabitans sp. Uapishka_5 TaxID=3037302 RepID=UPI0029E80CE3|nr:2-dehydro-3-deoxy-6-phosphogalactonate aldolase [Lichenihabitans sp. Uapishka_5]MDX7951157.1 2-dehydro-3-deoxy-6-phosphogalactonate aldolase [Lichenihabitans sp. Uapishka_5]